MTDWHGRNDVPPVVVLDDPRRIDAWQHSARIRGLERSIAVLLDEQRAHRTKRLGAFLAGSVIFFALGFTAGAAWSDTVFIGRTSADGSTVRTSITLSASEKPGVLAVVTYDNRPVNDDRDNGPQSLSIPEVSVGVEFTFDWNPVTGADRVVVIPPPGVTCEPEDCTATVMENFMGQVVLIDWRGV